MAVSPRPIVDITPFAVEPPHLGGQVVIRTTNAALAASGQPVEQYALGLRRGDLWFVGRARRVNVAPGYVEWRRTEPLSVALFLASAALGLPHLWAQRALTWRPWRALEQAIAGSVAVLVEMPWCYAPARVRPPDGIPLVYMSQNAEFVLAQAWRGRWGPLGNRLAANAEAAEAQMVRAADLNLTITAADAAALVERYKVAPEAVQVLPRGLDLESYQPLTAQARTTARRAHGVGDELVVLFVGSKHPPNLEAARHLAAIAPQLGPGFRCVIAGSVAPGLTPSPGVWLWPGDPTPWLQIADLAVNPMETGSGMNVKMLQYLAWVLPVVATPWGARGIQGQGDVHYLLASLPELAGAIQRLAADPTRRAQLGQAGRRLVEADYSAGATARQLLGYLDDCRRRLARNA